MFNELHSQAENNTYNETISQMQYSTVSLQLRGGGGGGRKEEKREYKKIKKRVKRIYGGGRQESKGALY